MRNPSDSSKPHMDNIFPSAFMQMVFIEFSLTITLSQNLIFRARDTNRDKKRKGKKQQHLAELEMAD